LQALILSAVGSVALLADLIHDLGDALTAIPVGVVASAAVALGAPIADPLIGLAIAALILRITWHAFTTVTERPSRSTHDASRPSPP